MIFSKHKLLGFFGIGIVQSQGAVGIQVDSIGATLGELNHTDDAVIDNSYKLGRNTLVDHRLAFALERAYAHRLYH